MRFLDKKIGFLWLIFLIAVFWLLSSSKYNQMSEYCGEGDYSFTGFVCLSYQPMVKREWNGKLITIPRVYSIVHLRRLFGLEGKSVSYSLGIRFMDLEYSSLILFGTVTLYSAELVEDGMRNVRAEDRQRMVYQGKYLNYNVYSDGYSNDLIRIYVHDKNKGLFWCERLCFASTAIGGGYLEYSFPVEWLARGYDPIIILHWIKNGSGL